MRRALVVAAALAALATGCPETLDLDTPRSYACSRDAGTSQCAEGSICGLEGYCRPRSATAWLCETDQDCSPAWRCGPDGRCADPAGDALVPGRFTSPTVELLNPRLLTGPTEHFAISSALDLQGRPTGNELDDALDLISGQTLTHLVRTIPEGDGGVIDVSVGRTTLPTSARGLATYGNRSFVLLASGEILDLQWDAGRAVVAGTFQPGFPADAIRVSEREYEYGGFATAVGTLLVAWNARTYALWGLRTDAGSGPLDFPLNPGDSVIDLFTHADSPPVPMAITDAGLLLFAPREPEGFVLSDGGFSDLSPEWAVESLPASFLDGGINVPRRGWSFLRGLNATPWIVFDTVSPGAPAQHRAIPFRTFVNSDRTIYLDQGFLDAPCRPGERLKAPFMRGSPTSASGPSLYQGDLEIRCESVAADGGRVDRVVRNHCEPEDPSYYYPFLCSIDEEEPSLPAEFPFSHGGRSALADPAGRVFTDDYRNYVYSTSGLGHEPLTLATEPQLVLSQGQQAFAFAPTSAGAPPHVLTDAGLVPLNAGPLPFALMEPVVGRPDWFVGRDTSGAIAVHRYLPPDQVRPIANFPQFDDFALGPYHAAVVDLPGGTVLVVSAFDTLLTAPVPPSGAPPPRPPVLDVRLVPLSRGTIQSFAVRPGDPVADGGVPALLDGYILAQERLFHFTAESESRWIHEEIPLSRGGEPRKVWLDGKRGRLGHAFGRIDSLPSGLPISRMLGPVEDYAQVCGQAFALTRTGLHRLEVQGSDPLGIWMPDDALTAAVPGGRTFGFTGRLQPTPDALLLLTGSGSVARARSPGCR